MSDLYTMIQNDTSGGGQVHIIHGGYIWVRVPDPDGLLILRCKERHCPATLQIFRDNIIIVDNNQVHRHQPQLTVMTKYEDEEPPVL